MAELMQTLAENLLPPASSSGKLARIREQIKGPSYKESFNLPHPLMVKVNGAYNQKGLVWDISILTLPLSVAYYSIQGVMRQVSIYL